MLVSFSRLFKGLALLMLLMVATSAVALIGVRAADASIFSHSRAQTNAQQTSSSFTFSMVPSPNITSCLPNAKGSVTITPGELNDLMKVSVTGLAPNTGYDFFVIQLPNKPFGISWYQSDLQ